MTDQSNQLYCSERQLAVFGLAIKELSQEDKPIINRLKLLQVHYDQLAGIAVGKIWKLILEGNYNPKTLKMQIDRMWPTQIEAHTDLLQRAIAATKHVDTEWALNAVDTDFEIRSFRELIEKWVISYNKIGELNLTDDELHEKWRKSCKEFLGKLNEVYSPKEKKNPKLDKYSVLLKGKV